MLSHQIYESVEQVPAAQWETFAAGNADLTLDRRLIGTMESTMRPEYAFFTIVVTDENGRAAAIACTWLFTVDLAQYPWLKRFTRALPARVSSRLKIGVLFCGLPQPAGQNQLRIAPGVDRPAAVAALNQALRQLAKQTKAALIVIKEFDGGECEQLQDFSRAGFLRCQIPPRHRIVHPFASFAAYLDAQKSRYRAQVNRSLKKFASAGFRAEQVYGPDRLGEVLTDEAHGLYRAVWDRSSYKLELLPPQFARELGRRFGADASLTCVYQGQRLAGYTLGLMSGDIYYNVISGVDYQIKSEGDVYFNLFYHDMDYAWKRGAREIDLGLTSDDFKSRLGSRIEPLHLYIDGRSRLVSWGLKRAARWAFPPVKPVTAHQIFKQGVIAPEQRGASMRV